MPSFNQVVLRAIADLGEGTYGAPIHQAVEQMLVRTVGIAELYIALGELESQGYIRTWQGSGTPERGGRRKLHAAVTESGLTHLISTEGGV